MDRRLFLQTTAIAAGGILLAACEGGGDGAAGLPQPTAPQTLAVQAASFEYLTGADRWLAFGVNDVQNRPLDAEAAIEVYLRRIPTTPEMEADVLAGPFEATFSPAVDTGQGVYYLQTDLDEPGFVDIVVLSGDDYGSAAVEIVDPADSQVRPAEEGRPLVPGALAVSAPTPTVQDDRGVFSICTQSPQCGMHEMSLDEALTSGRPVALMFATPQFCQTAVCGPSVLTLDSLRNQGGWGDTIFVHSEIFAEEPSGTGVAGTPLVEAVEAWGLPTEPWFFTIGSDGMIQDRLDGPMPMPILSSMLERLAT
ncbi:thioredoxin family protein [soil metagenome]